MQSNFYVGLSAQISLQRRLETIANNVANARPRASAPRRSSSSTCCRASRQTPSPMRPRRQTYLSRKSGELVRTDNMLDVAVQGEAWLAVQTPTGTAYTRDGRMKMTETGELVYAQQPADARRRRRAAAARPQRRPADASPATAPSVSRARQIGAIGLFTIDQRAKLDPRRERRRRARPAGRPSARLRQGRRAPGLHRALQRQSGAWR